ncbi:MAG: MBL fold metallo-hydrolase, partial [Thiohalophilus sp.]
ADETFTDTHDFSLGGVRFELKHVGPAHTPGDILVWLPKEQVVFSGDVVYVGRMLGITAHSDSRQWITAFETMAELEPRVIVPGHGPATDLARARADTLDYLVYMRKTVGEFMEASGDITRVGDLDQSDFARLANFDLLAGRNAQQLYQQMEWE